ncbi:MAG TPA: secretion system protein E, partial [Opitutae bacterium]|nr:secretion system protein E [Opitutae bacterium]
MDLNSLYSDLTEQQRSAVISLPRSERLVQIASLKNVEVSELVELLAELSGLSVAKNIELVENPSAVLPLRLIHEYQCIPVQSTEKIDSNNPSGAVTEDTINTPLPLVTLWPPEPKMDRWIYAMSGRHPEWQLGHPEIVSNTITQQFGVGAGSLDDSEIITDVADSNEVEDEDAAVIRFVNEVVNKAMADRATDIHFEPLREDLQIRYRIDGELISVRVPDNLIKFQGAIISRLKIMAKLNISEKRRPQDGRISFGSGANELDIRISTIPTMYGESVSLRLLSQKSKPLSMAELGLATKSANKLTRALETPHGIILVTGPTGSGKSTSLTAYIRLINKPERRIITVEDPVEYEVPGVNQTQVQPDIGLTFANSLRSVLRQ